MDRSPARAPGRRWIDSHLLDMIFARKKSRVRDGCLLGTSAFAVVLIAAATDGDRNWARIRSMPLEQRTKLLENLRRFDLELSPDRQEAIRDLDRRLAALDASSQSQYLAVLRRYHNWLNGLPEHRREEILSKAPAERMAQVQKLAVEHAVPKVQTPQLLRIAELGEYSPFELASIYKICQRAEPAALAKVEKVAQGPRRREALFRLGEVKGIPRETVPPQFDEEHWVSMVERQWKNRPAFLLEELLKKRADEVIRKKQELRRKEILHRQAINLYYDNTNARPVDPERLAQFARALPAWVRATLDHYPPDEARRRVSNAYRLVFPYPDEIKPGSHQQAAAPGPARGGPATPPERPSPAKRGPGGSSNAPF
jgi:hypothetical protein